MLPATPRTHLALALTLAMLGVRDARGQSQGPPPASVQVDTLRLESVENLREVTGELRASRRALIASEESGRVIAIPLKEGDKLAPNQIIAELDARIASMEVRQSQADCDALEAVIAERRAELAQANRNLSRIETLIQQSSASQTELSDARSLVERAEARVAQSVAQHASSLAAHERSQKRLDDMIIRAPFESYVVSLQTEIGEWVNQGQSVAEIVSLDIVETWLDVPERFVDRLRTENTSIIIRVPALESEFSATNLSIIPVADPLARIFPVRAEIDNPETKLRPGMSVVGLVPTGQQIDVLTVHKDAVLRDDAGQFVYYDDNGVAKVARIEQLFPVDGRIAVRAGRLQPGTSVVIEGNERLYPGAPLNILNPLQQTASDTN
ncbi:MAG: efflux RND transporter periplasmic adaptor subunit [Planctomycetota bacterium]|jgi:RND family efflux transporter MFP subunit